MNMGNQFSVWPWLQVYVEFDEGEKISLNSNHVGLCSTPIWMVSFPLQEGRDTFPFLMKAFSVLSERRMNDSESWNLRKEGEAGVGQHEEIVVEDFKCELKDGEKNKILFHYLKVNFKLYLLTKHHDQSEVVHILRQCQDVLVSHRWSIWHRMTL
jgi:hypothetical protein